MKIFALSTTPAAQFHRSSLRVLFVCASAGCLGGARHPASAVNVVEAYAFTNGGDGGGPSSGLLIDSAGSIYGTAFSGGANGYGAVYRLTPTNPQRTAWTESVLWNFTGGDDGGVPFGTLISDSSGALYGTTSMGGKRAGNAGTVFKLSPPAAGQTAWTQTTLWSFQRNENGSAPAAGLIADASGALYGTTEFYGTFGAGAVFRLTPPASGQTNWTETTLWSFSGGADGGRPKASLLIDKAGNLYGTTSRGGSRNAIAGAVFMLSPPAGGAGVWTETTLFSFSGPDGAHLSSALIADSHGALYGTAPFGGTDGRGVAFRLAPPLVAGGDWSESTIWNFSATTGGAYPFAALLADKSGALYGTTYGYSPYTFYTIPSSIFRLDPPVAGNTSWTGTILALTTEKLGTDLMAPLSADRNGRLYTTAQSVGRLNESTLKINGGVLKISGAGFALH